MTTVEPPAGEQVTAPDIVAYTVHRMAAVYALDDLRCYDDATRLRRRVRAEMAKRRLPQLAEMLTIAHDEEDPQVALARLLWDALESRARNAAAQMVCSGSMTVPDSPADLECPDPAGHRELERKAAQEMRQAPVYRPGHCVYCGKPIGGA